MGKYRDHQEKANRALLVAFFVVVIVVISAVLIYTDVLGIRTALFGTQEDYTWAETDDYYWNFDYFADHHIRGQFTDQVSGQTHEIFSKVQYIGSWKRGGTDHASETLVAGGQYGLSSGLYNYYPLSYWYKVSWSDSLNGPWTTISEPGDTASFVTASNPGRIDVPKEWWTEPGYRNMQSYPFEIRGDYKNYVRVEVKVRYQDEFIPTNKVTKTATDVCKMLSGIGEVYLQSADDLFEEGEQVTFVMNTGYSGKSTGEDDKGWELRIIDPNGDPVEVFTDIPDDKIGVTRTWTVPVGSFQPSWSNQYRAVLYNTIINYDNVKTFVIDNKEWAPSKPSISFSGGDEPGEEVIVTLTSTPNEETGARIDYFMADVHYEGGSYIKQDLKVNAVDNTGTFTYTPNLGGSYVIVSASAHDTEGRPSGASTNSRYVKHPYEEEEEVPWWQEYWWAIALLGGGLAVGGYMYNEDYRKNKGKRRE